jgi:uncharacterized protein with NAD-binding domain and iron-sulfur cluster
MADPNPIRRRRYEPTPARFVIVGGGVASFVTGIELRDRFPQARITLLSAADDSMLGGQLASWDEDGYPIEHGLHVLFGFYEHFLPLLQRVGADVHFTRSRKHTFVYERGKLHRFSFRTWLATYTGFSKRERLQLAMLAPRLAAIVARVKLRGLGALTVYDAFDLRELGRLHGLPESVLDSNFVRQLYDPAFNGPRAFSATVALQSLYQMFAKPWHYYFDLPTREGLVEPLRRYFVDVCQGEIICRQRLLRVRVDERATRVVGLDIQDEASGQVCQVEADEYVLALGLEDFKNVDLTAAAQHPYFQHIHRLETVSSVSLQAWFKRDPVPAEIDSLIGGLPEPLSILCPLSRVRKQPPDLRQQLPYMLMATGPEAGFEGVADTTLVQRFFDVLAECGFSLPADRREIRVVVRRNTEPFHRYLLTRPGDLSLRPTPQSPLANLCLAGAWVRNTFTLPSVEAAAESGKVVAELIGHRQPVRSLAAAPFAGMPRVSPLVMQPPYRFPRSHGSFFLLDVDPVALAQTLPPQLTTVHGLRHKLLIAIVEHQAVSGDHDPSGASYSYGEVMLAAIVRKRAAAGIGGLGLYPIYLYVDDDAAMAAGREVYGFPKKMARLEIGTQAFSVTRLGRQPATSGGPAAPIEILSGCWNAPTSQPALPAVPTAAPLKRIAGALGSLLATHALHRIVVPPFYTTRELPQPTAQAQAQPSLSELMRVRADDFRIQRAVALDGARFKLGASLNDQLYRLALGSSLELATPHGAYIEFGFSFATAQSV